MDANPSIMKGASTGLFMSYIFMALIVLPIFSEAITQPAELDRLLRFKEETINERGERWRKALDSWQCKSGDLDNCDPCGDTAFGEWDHLHCRGSSPGKDGQGPDGGELDGMVTNVHISDQKVNGSIPSQLRWFPQLREIDFDGGSLSGPLPEWLGTTFPDLAELDISYNEISGTIPSWLSKMSNLVEFELNYNRLTGTLPDALGQMPSLAAIELNGNKIRGKIPSTMSDLPQTFTSLLIGSNWLYGELDPLSSTRFIQVSVHNNVALCGMVPASVRYAKGFSIENTGLGWPCPGSS